MQLFLVPFDRLSRGYFKTNVVMLYTVHNVYYITIT